MTAVRRFPNCSAGQLPVHCHLLPTALDCKSAFRWRQDYLNHSATTKARVRTASSSRSRSGSTSRAAAFSRSLSGLHNQMTHPMKTNRPALGSGDPPQLVCRADAILQRPGLPTNEHGLMHEVYGESHSIASRLYTSSKPNSRRHSSRISNRSARPSSPYACGDVRSFAMCPVNARPNAAARRCASADNYKRIGRTWAAPSDIHDTCAWTSMQ